eukprot:TRINITY_DN27886_c0_g1_i1.p1 TRINITY_DN27886_c0_g1~~TRINITY_DN27886_c0_g1_i1.p1  ORF type:complete len:358 (-),score=92.45 TRINITY_DN27886_c0_g1_i1:46-1119(-)
MSLPIVVLFNPRDYEHDPIIHFIDAKLTEHPEKPRRSKFILNSIRNGFKDITYIECDREATEEELQTVHSGDLIHFINNAWDSWYKFSQNADQELLVNTFPTLCRGVAHKPHNLHLQTAFYCFDISTPLGKNTARLARISAGMALDAAKKVAQGLDGPFQQLHYVLCRPPGHHSTHGMYGGYCYFNNIALAAHELSKYGKVAILDVDYHHGNGTQDIFYERDDVMFISIHADPEFEYPWYSGTANEIGVNKGTNFNRNIPLPADTDWSKYKPALLESVELLKKFDPKIILISLGLDTADGDPICVFHLKPQDYLEMGTIIRNIGKPILVIQEGGYSGENVLGPCAASFLKGVSQQFN